MKTKQLLVAALVALILASTATRVQAWEPWDWCEDNGWFWC